MATNRSRAEPGRRPRFALRRDLRLIHGEGLAFSVMVGAGESYFAAFVLALGLGEVASGLVTTVPLLAGGALQLVTPAGIRWVGSRRRWSVACATIQAASFGPLLAAVVVGAAPAWVVFAAATLYWSAGMAISPAWNSWVEWLVPSPVRRRYFAWRSSAVQLGTMLGLVGGGLALQAATDAGRPLAGFGALFATAALCRVVSARLLAAQSDAPPPPIDSAGLPALGVLRRLPHSPGARLVTYLLTLTAGVTVASPFFSAYMLVHLELSYTSYMLLIATSVAAKVAALPLLGGLTVRHGLLPVLRVAWLGIAAVPALWLVSSSYPYLVLLQITAGVVWAAHEYAAFLLLFETIPAERRIPIMTVFNLTHAVALVGGSLLGGWLLAHAETGRTAYVTIFLASTGLRGAAVLLLARVHDRIRLRTPPAFRTVAVRPAVGLVLRPILATLRRRDSARGGVPPVLRSPRTDAPGGDPGRSA